MRGLVKEPKRKGEKSREGLPFPEKKKKKKKKRKLYTRRKKKQLRMEGEKLAESCLPAEQFCSKKDICFFLIFIFWTRSDLLYPPPCPSFLFGTFKKVLLFFYNSDLLGVIAETFPLLWL